MADSDKLNVFISSTMTELGDVRDVVQNELVEMGRDLFEPFVYEAKAGSGPGTTSDEYLTRLQAADVYMGLFWKSYGEGTIAEYHHARRLEKPCFIYIRGQDLERAPELNEFLREHIYGPKVRWTAFSSPVQVGRQAAGDIVRWLIRQHRHTGAMRRDENMSYEEAMRMLEETLRMLKARLDERRQEKLAAAQGYWEKFRDANADFIADDASEGTMGRILRITTLVEMISARTADLKKNLEQQAFGPAEA
jgi:uncharacterized protein YecT (DUF1311 family)